jgi:hypothetical protein
MRITDWLQFRHKPWMSSVQLARFGRMVCEAYHELHDRHPPVIAKYPAYAEADEDMLESLYQKFAFEGGLAR